MDKELKQLRNNRWDKAFSGEVPVTEEEVDAAVNRKATIVVSTRYAHFEISCAIACH